MQTAFHPDGRCTLIGSQPLSDHREATRMILTFTPEVPTWPQLPVYPAEGMIPQFAAGLPGLRREDGRLFADTAADDFDEQMVAFFEDYLAAGESSGDSRVTRFALDAQIAPGFFALLEALDAQDRAPSCLKGQITGPITFCTALKDRQGRPIFYHEALRDAAVKMIARKAAWQAGQLGRFGAPVLVFIDEPALAGYGSSELISISQEDIATCLREVVAELHAAGALAGVHVCANTDWSLLLNSDLDVINFDAFGYFEKFRLYAGEIRRYLQSGRWLAWGLMPTLDPRQVEAATLEALWRDWQAKSRSICELGFTPEALRRQSLITPSCGTGSLTPALSRKVLELTRALSESVRAA